MSIVYAAFAAAAPKQTTCSEHIGKMDSSDRSYDDNERLLTDPGSQERSPSITNIFALEGQSLYDKKIMIVNREFDSMGMGRYQWW